MKKKEVEPARIRTGWFSSIQTKEFFDELGRFCDDIKGRKKEVKLSVHRYVRERLTAFGVLILAIPALITLLLSDAPYTFFDLEDSMLRFSIKHAGRHVKEEAMPTAEELKKLPPHMRVRVPKAGERFPVYVEVEIDGKKVISNSYKPGGLKQEGASYAYEKVIVAPGIHKVIVRMSDTGSPEHFDFVYDKELEFKAGRQICIDFDGGKKEFYIRN